MADRPSIILATSNGTGMGHLARQLAVAKALEGQARVTLFSLSVAVPIAAAQGVPGEYCPGVDRGWIPETSWPHYLAGRLATLVWEVEADVVVFDGVAPYRGITLARSRLRDTAFCWFRRGMWQRGANDGQLWKSALFDLIVEPGDIAAEADTGPTATREDAVRVPPVSLIEVVDRFPRQEAASQLGIDPDRPTLLLTLGTGRLGEVAGPGKVVLDTVLESRDWQVCVATSAVAETRVPLADDPRVTELLGVFPLARYLSAFDAAVSSAGYNAVHEYLPAGLATLLVPNLQTRTDDQEARARFLAERRLALAASPDSPEALAETTRTLLQQDTRDALRAALAGLPVEQKKGGAEATARLLIELAKSYQPAPRTLATRLLQARDDFKEGLKRFLGPAGTNLVRRLLRRPPIVSGDRLRVVIDAEPSGPDVRRLTITSSPDIGQLLAGDPVEHVLHDPSASYIPARRLLIDRHYQVVG